MLPPCPTEPASTTRLLPQDEESEDKWRPAWKRRGRLRQGSQGHCPVGLGSVDRESWGNLSMPLKGLPDLWVLGGTAKWVWVALWLQLGTIQQREGSWTPPVPWPFWDDRAAPPPILPIPWGVWESKKWGRARQGATLLRGPGGKAGRGAPGGRLVEAMLRGRGWKALEQGLSPGKGFVEASSAV